MGVSHSVLGGMYKMYRHIVGILLLTASRTISDFTPKKLDLDGVLTRSMTSGFITRKRR